MSRSSQIPRHLPLRHSSAPDWWSRGLPEIESTFERVVLEKFATDASGIFRAKDFARASHAGQTREGGGEYLIHPLRVAISLSLELGVEDPILFLSAVLHDVIEDSNYGRRELAQEFGSPVADLVSTLSRNSDEKRPPAGDSFRSDYFTRVSKSGAPGVLLKSADKLDNLRDALYHPAMSKRRILVEEVDNVYVPLIDSLTNDDKLQERLKALLRGAAESHSLKSLIGILDEETKTANYGDRVVVPQACLDAPLLHYLLFNPTLTCWLGDDDIQLTKSAHSPREIAANVARKYAALTGGDRKKELLEFAGARAELANARNQRHWDKARAQWLELVRLLEAVPEWCIPIFEPDASPWLLLLVHSVLFRPANWVFPMWHSDYGAKLAVNVKGSAYAHGRAESDIDGYHAFLRFLLTKREALWRLATGTGTLARAESVFDAAALCSGIPSRTLWSLRLLSEYLDVFAEAGGNHRSSTASDFSCLWDEVAKASFQSSALSEIELFLLDHADDLRPILTNDIDIVGLDEVRTIFAEAGRQDEFAILLRLLMEHCRTEFESSAKWISFETSEFLKRRGETFSDQGGLRLSEKSRFEDLAACGIRSFDETSENRVILKVFPGKRFALQNRLPELSQTDLATISAKAYSAVAIFDTLVIERMKRPEPLWVPRVYRILDTIEDLDPKNAQAIEVALRCPDKVVRFKTCLPLPTDEAQADGAQARRREIVARYIVAQIYNYGITRRVLSATIECACLDVSRAAHGFTNESLMKMISQAEGAFGFRSLYGHFIESFNFSPFRITGESAADGGFQFGEADMRSGGFLGIDIGGTDVKFTLFADGKPQAQGAKGFLGTTPTFSPKGQRIAAQDFCARLVSEIDQWFDHAREMWSQIYGIGISWPGAVRENRIACFSGTLQGLEYQGKGFDSNSPAAMIHSFPFLDLFGQTLRDFAQSKGLKLDPSLTLILENDGNAEAFGNYCSRVLDLKNKPGGKLIVKLGTSLAGGRVLRDSSIADDVAEFSKIVLNLNRPQSRQPQGVARDYISSLGVRNLSRTFQFRGKLLFGPRRTENTEQANSTRVEAVELGGLLNLGFADSRQAFLEELIRTDNHPDDDICNEFVKDLRGLLSQTSPGEELASYVQSRGREWEGRYPIQSDVEPAEPVNVWQRGWGRVHWLCTGKHADYSDLPDLAMPASFPIAALAEKAAGTIALFSQLALHIAHAVAALYNIYRRDSFNEVILAGGVLSGATGELVKSQAEKFLEKYYDKIYGEGKNLPPDAVQLADSKDRDTMGPRGAAMLANRAHKGTRLKRMHLLVDLLIRELPPGGSLTLEGVVADLLNNRISATRVEVRDYLFAKVAESELIPQDDGEEFIKPVEASS